MARAKNGKAISPERRTPKAHRELQEFIRDAEKRGYLGESRRGCAVLGYIEGRRVAELCVGADASRGSVNRWLQWYETAGVEGLGTSKP